MKTKVVVTPLEQVGHITILREVEPREYLYGSTKFTVRRILCRCSCGKDFVTNLSTVKTRRVQSCGCLRGRTRGGEYKKRVPFTTKTRQDDNRAAYTNLILNYYRKGARRRGLDFDLTRDEFCHLIVLPCRYCGGAPRFHNRTGSYLSPFPWNGIDRKDNLAGYTKENSVPCCSKCNAAKSKLSEVEFLDLVARVFAYSIR